MTATKSATQMRADGPRILLNDLFMLMARLLFLVAARIFSLW